MIRRPPRSTLSSSSAASDVYKRQSYNHLTDCLAPLSEDCPQGIWTVKYDATLGVVSVQNMYYPGSIFWYSPESASRFGQLYFGTGERCLDLCFQLPGKLMM
eukprot:TRINITY_DN62988_c0_g1_i1.p1 TRINITY_DN62988_c0_g1~~TRINITY_DN62988_c0_g1_i1.p1  ORF type:complete len:102 (+),score=22.67 TRINITY_DN62988_c0_g1_i1:121-426(+)